MSVVRSPLRAVRSWLGRRVEIVGGDVAQAAVMFAVAGGASVVYDVLPRQLDNRSAAVVLDSATLMIGLTVLFLPWDRWPRWCRLVLPLLALVQLSINRVAGVVPDDTYAIWLVLVFVWVGLNQPPRFGLRLAPIAVATYAAPFAFGVPASGAAIASLVIAAPMSIVIAESLSQRAAAVRSAEAEREQALAALARANLTDDLTGVGNRRHANAMLDSLLDGDALVVLDLDHFKSINDTLGHQRGDLLLHELGAFLTTYLGDSHRSARYGGEEFVLVLRVADHELEASVSALLDAWRASQPIVTLSAGVAVKVAGGSWSETFAAADAALYRAKQSGRDRAELHTAIPAAPPAGATTSGAN